MTENYIATFYSHYGAIHFRQLCTEFGFRAELMPVPRDLSSSCGTCVRFHAEDAWPADLKNEETEKIVRITEHGYEPVFNAENS